MTLRRVGFLFSLVAVALWVGGLVVLGAVVAPTIFRNVPAPESANAMTLVFRRFDRVAMACAAIVLVVEVLLALYAKPLLRRDLVRGGVAIVLSAFAIVQGTWISPAIASLHQAGAIRGSGELGVRLEERHRVAEALGKSQVVFGLVFIGLCVWRLSERARAGTKPANSGR